MSLRAASISLANAFFKTRTSTCKPQILQASFTTSSTAKTKPPRKDRPRNQARDISRAHRRLEKAIDGLKHLENAEHRPFLEDDPLQQKLRAEFEIIVAQKIREAIQASTDNARKALKGDGTGPAQPANEEAHELTDMVRRGDIYDKMIGGKIGRLHGSIGSERKKGDRKKSDRKKGGRKTGPR